MSDSKVRPIIGLTGGIGTGKSTACAYLKKKGFKAVDADLIARQIVEPGEPLLELLKEAFGSEIIKKEDKSLDRKALAALVFSDKEKRKTLDHLMHSRIIQVMEQQIGDYEKQDIPGILIDAPLLFETGLDKRCGRTWLITAELALRVARVCARDSITPEEVRARISSQMDDNQKQALADRIIDNSGTTQDLYKKLDELLIQEGYEAL